MSIILTVNAGSTNTKLAAFDVETWERKGHTVTHSVEQTDEWMCSIGQYNIVGVGHRVVHGGREYTQPVEINDEVLGTLKSLTPLAPLHQPASIRLIEEARKLYPNVPHVACFDTAFHHTIPEMERRLPLPVKYHEEGVQRYGFHGLSYEYIASVLQEHAANEADGRVVVAHLGGGSSACAMKNRRSVASTMGFSTIDGLMMGTRSGAFDPGALLYLLEEKNLKPQEISQLLYHESGLQGVSGISADIRELSKSDAPQAKEAIELYCYLAAKQIASLLPAIGGLDALVFTGGIGENSAEIRDNIAEKLQWAGDVPVYVIPTDEEQVIAKSCDKWMKNTSHAAA